MFVNIFRPEVDPANVSIIHHIVAMHPNSENH